MACRVAALPAAARSRSRRAAKILYDLTHADQSGRAHALLRRRIGGVSEIRARTTNY